jgi:uncharacterized protein HemX
MNIIVAIIFGLILYGYHQKRCERREEIARKTAKAEKKAAKKAERQESAENAELRAQVETLTRAVNELRADKSKE